MTEAEASEQKVTPWEAHAAEGAVKIDYDKLIRKLNVACCSLGLQKLAILGEVITGPMFRWTNLQTWAIYLLIGSVFFLKLGLELQSLLGVKYMATATATM